MKSKVGEMEEEIRGVNLRRLSKYMTDVVQDVVGKRGYLVRFQDGGEKEMSLTLLTIVDFMSEVEEDI